VVLLQLVYMWPHTCVAARSYCPHTSVAAVADRCRTRVPAPAIPMPKVCGVSLTKAGVQIIKETLETKPAGYEEAEGDEDGGGGGEDQDV
jgi:hypothetical protein